MGPALIQINTVCYTGLYLGNILKWRTQSIENLGWESSQHAWYDNNSRAWLQEKFLK